MKRWKPTRNGSVFELVPEVSVPLPDSGHSLLFSNGSAIFFGTILG